MFHFFQNIAAKALGVVASAIIAAGIVKMPQPAPPIVAQHHSVTPTAQTDNSKFNLFANSTTTPTSVSPGVVKKKSAVLATPVNNISLVQQATPQTAPPAVVCNNVSGGSLPAGWFSDGQGNCSPAPPKQQAQQTNVVAPISTGFTADPSRITAGNSTTLYFNLYNNPTSVTITPDIGSVLGASSIIVTPAATTIYTLTASNSAGQITEQAWVHVNTLGASCDNNGDVWLSNNNCGVTPPPPAPTLTPIQAQATRIISAIHTYVDSIGVQDITLNNEINACGKICYQQSSYPTWIAQLDSDKTTLQQLGTIIYEIEDYENTGVPPPASDRGYLLTLGIVW